MIVDDEDFHRDDFTVVLQPFMENIFAPRKVMLLLKASRTPCTRFHKPVDKEVAIISADCIYTML